MLHPWHAMLVVAGQQAMPPVIQEATKEATRSFNRFNSFNCDSVPATASQRLSD
jgi:hypothetical protein